MYKLIKKNNEKRSVQVLDTQFVHKQQQFVVYLFICEIILFTKKIFAIPERNKTEFETLRLSFHLSDGNET